MGLWLRSQRPRRGQDKGNPESYQVGEVCEVLGAHPGFLDHWDPGIGTQEVEGIPPALLFPLLYDSVTPTLLMSLAWPPALPPRST